MNITGTTRTYDILTFGDTCVDLILTGRDVTPRFDQVEKLVDGYTLEMGGSCCIFACQAAKLGMRVAILGRVGDDDFGRLILHRLQESGVDTRFMVVDPQLKTGVGVALSQGNDRAILTYLGTLNALQPEDVRDEHLAAARHLHHGSYYLQTGVLPALPDIFQRAKALGLSISLDPNWDPGEEWASNLAELYALTDIFLPNDQEALRISRQSDLDLAAAWFLKRGVRTLAIKQGRKGSRVHAGGAAWDAPVEPVSGGDSVGAGDSFDAGFLAGILRGLPIRQSLEIATICGRSVASRVGGLAGQPHWEDVSRLIQP